MHVKENKISDTEPVVSVTLLPDIEKQLSGNIGKEDRLSLVTRITDRKICNDKDDSYIGVGFIYNPGSFRVTYIPEYYPAYRAGIRMGDFVTNPEEPIVDGFVDLLIIREHNEQIRFRIKAERICLRSE